MKKFLTIFTVSLLSSAILCQSISCAQAEEEPRISHYEAATVESSEEAFDILDQKTIEIGDILKDKGDDLDLEKIHEICYTLGAAVDRLRTEKAMEDSKLDILDEQVQALHFAAENQEEAKFREWFAKFKDFVGTIDDSDGALIEKKDFYELIIKDHKFSPAELIVPVGQKIKLIVDNQDQTPEEFESHDLNREKIISGNSKATIFIGPLKAGKYNFFGEFNVKTANGHIIAK